MKLNFFCVFSKKNSNTKFHENSFSGSRVVQCGQTDGRQNGQHNEANSRFFAILRRRTSMWYLRGGNVRHAEIGTTPWSCPFTNDILINAECIFMTSYVKWPCDGFRATVRIVMAKWSLQHPMARWSLQHPMQDQILTSKGFYQLEKRDYDEFCIAVQWHLIVGWIKWRHYICQIEWEHGSRFCLRTCFFIVGLWRKTQKCFLLLLRFLSGKVEWM